MNRRKFNQKLGTGAALTIGWSFLGSCGNSRPNTWPAALSDDFNPDIDLELTPLGYKDI